MEKSQAETLLIRKVVAYFSQNNLSVAQGRGGGGGGKYPNDSDGF